mmetsp:Transcript_49823/g.98200  ORF Transcript_49823/g.98200 Transcript_49823/m.98200 type:complete len:125 (+) Transcript_49823:316-690(+)
MRPAATKAFSRQLSTDMNTHAVPCIQTNKGNDARRLVTEYMLIHACMNSLVQTFMRRQKFYLFLLSQTDPHLLSSVAPESPHGRRHRQLGTNRDKATRGDWRNDGRKKEIRKDDEEEKQKSGLT